MHLFLFFNLLNIPIDWDLFRNPRAISISPNRSLKILLDANAIY